MLLFIYQRLLIVLEWIGKLWRSQASIERRLERIERKTDAIKRQQDEDSALLAALAAAEIPEPAVTVQLIAGPIVEQP